MCEASCAACFTMASTSKPSFTARFSEGKFVAATMTVMHRAPSWTKGYANSPRRTPREAQRDPGSAAMLACRFTPFQPSNTTPATTSRPLWTPIAAASR